MNQRKEFTYRMLSACLKPGMRVLDVGCGSGDVSLLAAELVGESGHVSGIDISADMLALARAHAADRGICNVDFAERDIAKAVGEYDAIIGRRVLMYLPDVKSALERLKNCLKPGGIMAFQESDIGGMRLNDGFALCSRVQGWIWAAVQHEGGDVHIGSRLYGLMKQAGLNVRGYYSENVLQTAQTGSDLAWVAKVMTARITASGAATADEIDADTLEARIMAELQAADAAFVRDTAYAICAAK